MMTSDQHQDVALSLLADADNCAPLEHEARANYLRAAQVHATLAAIPQPVELLPALYQPEPVNSTSWPSPRDGVVIDPATGFEYRKIERNPR